MRYCPSCGSRFSSEDAAFCPHDGAATRELPEQAPPEDPLLGRVIDGRYQVRARIGEGGMGIVYMAEHTVLGKKLALKVLRGDMARDADVVQRFIQEARTASSIGHPNIVDISDFGRLPDGAVYFAMEHLDGDPLARFIARGGSVPMHEAISIIEQIASALGAAHARGVVHRDMKPDNVFVLRRGGGPVVKVLDFGIAKVGGAGAKLTRTGVVFGTPHYMSPEQAAGQAVDGRTDVYALGVIMYEMFTGKVPFDADTYMGILSKHMFETPVPPGEATGGPKLGAIEDVILRALAKKPEERYQSMEELLDDLSTVRAGGTVAVGGRAGAARSPDGLANALEPPSRTEMRLSSGDGVLPETRAPRIALAVVASVAVAGGLAGLGLALAGDDEPSVVDAEAGNDEPSVVDAEAGDEDPHEPAPSSDEAGETLPAGKELPPAPSPVHVTSRPQGALLFVDGAMIGNAPAEIPRPGEGDEQRLVVKQAGYRSKELTLTEASPERISVELQELERAVREKRVRRRRRPPATRTDRRSTPEAEPERDEGEPDKAAAPREDDLITGEVVDPWAQ
ncbi:MAG: serine/threonine-protein kinase [Myxococcota bacterium]